MLTERAPRKVALRVEFQKSDLLTSLPLPADNRLHEQAKSIALALKGGQQRASNRCAPRS